MLGQRRLGGGCVVALDGKTGGFAEKRGGVGRSWFPAFWPGTTLLVEAGGQHIHGFRRGLDYAFIRALR